MGKIFDVFLSYASADSALADPLVLALERVGVTVWRDTQLIDTFDDIQQGITQGLTHSKLLLALYSHNYTQRRACDWELASAFVAGGKDRILVLNPEDGADHIQPQSLRESRFANRDDLTDPDAVAAKIKAQVAAFTTTLGELPKAAPDQKWVGLSPNGGAQTFVGRRAEIWQVHDGLAAGSVLLAPTTFGTAPGYGSTLLRGLGGMGKTLLAEEYARRFAAAWPGGIFWLKAGGPLMDQYLMLAGKLGASFDPADPSSLERAVTEALAARPGAYLWVVDDLPHGLNAEQARAWFAPTPQGRTLVTTRTRTLDAIAKPVELAELGEEEAFTLLTLNRTPQNEAEEQTARAIVEELGRHALAVDLARHLVTLQGYDEVLADLRDPSEEALSLAGELELELPTGHEKSITQTFLRSIQSLKATALDALRIAACLAPHTPIPNDLLAAILQQADGVAEKQARKAAPLGINQTAAHSLCETTDAGYVVHALVCRTMALRYADDRSQILRQAGLKMLTNLFGNLAPDARQHPRLAPLLPHARAISEELETAEQADLAGWLGRYYHAAGLYPAAKEHITGALEAERRVLGPDHPDTLVSMGNLAGTLLAQGDLTGARDFQKQVLEAHRRILGADHPATLTAMNNLAQTLKAQGDVAAARDLQERVLEARRHLLGADHPATLTAMNNLASTLAVQGDLAGARDLHEKELAACRRILGPDHPQTLISMNNLAVTLFAQGDRAGARELQQQVLEARRRILGPDHPDTLISMGNLATTLDAQGDRAGARESRQQVLDAHRRILGPDHPDTLISMNNLAQTLFAQGDRAGARDLQQQVLEARRRILGPDHPDTLKAALMQAQYVAFSGELAEAVDLAAWAAQGLGVKLGPDHPHTQMAREILAILTAPQESAPGPD